MARRFRNILGPKIRELRMKAGMSQDDLAAKLQLAGLENFDRVILAKVEAQIRSIYEYKLIVLVTVLKASPEELLSVPHRSLRSQLSALVGRRFRD